MNRVLISLFLAITALKAEISGECKLILFNLLRVKLLNFDFRKKILFFGLCLRIMYAAYLYNFPDERNFNLYFLEIRLAPVDLPVAAPPSQAI